MAGRPRLARSCRSGQLSGVLLADPRSAAQSCWRHAAAHRPERHFGKCVSKNPSAIMSLPQARQMPAEEKWSRVCFVNAANAELTKPRLQLAIEPLSEHGKEPPPRGLLPLSVRPEQPAPRSRKCITPERLLVSLALPIAGRLQLRLCGRSKLTAACKDVLLAKDLTWR